MCQQFLQPHPNEYEKQKGAQMRQKKKRVASLYSKPKTNSKYDENTNTQNRANHQKGKAIDKTFKSQPKQLAQRAGHITLSFHFTYYTIIPESCEVFMQNFVTTWDLRFLR